MNYISIHPNYFLLEGFGTLMSHYALLYSISKDIDLKPSILALDFSNQQQTAMEFFNNFNEPILYHSDVFPNLSKTFTTLNGPELAGSDWNILNLLNLSYDQIISNIVAYKHTNLLVFWTLNHKLITKYLNEICNYLYVFSDKTIDISKDIIPDTDSQTVAVCVRNEYKKINTEHIKLSMKFYEEAFSHYDKKSKYIIFNDDIIETKQNFQYLESVYDISYIPNIQSAIGLCAMSLCDHIISANSSFSYWAGLLNKNQFKKIICPQYYVNDNDVEFAKTLNNKWYPSDWIALETI